MNKSILAIFFVAVACNAQTTKINLNNTDPVTSITISGVTTAEVLQVNGTLNVDGAATFALGVIAPTVYGAFNNGAVGYTAMSGITNSYNNTVAGFGAMKNASNCYNNGAFAYNAMANVSGCDYNSIVGYSALSSAKDCDKNGAIGYYTMQQASNCDHNVASGEDAMRYATNCDYNAANGYGAMQYAKGMNTSLALGTFAGYKATDGLAVGFIDCYFMAPSDPHNPTNDVIYFENGNLSLGRGGDTVPVNVRGLLKIKTEEYADNAAAIAGGLTVETIYRTGDLLKIVH